MEATRERNRMAYPNHLQTVEKQICDSLVTAAINRPEGLFIRVYDGEEWATKWTRDAKAISAATAATDETSYHFGVKNAEGKMNAKGYILLIHGNDEDLISDSAHKNDDPEAEKLIDALCAASIYRNPFENATLCAKGQ